MSARDDYTFLYFIFILAAIVFIPSYKVKDVLPDITYSARDIIFNPRSIEMSLGEDRNFSVLFRKPLPVQCTFSFTYQDNRDNHIASPGNLPIEPLNSFTVDKDSNTTYHTIIFAKSPGLLQLGLSSTDLNITDIEILHTSITVYRRKSLFVLQQIVGWVYFLAWIASFYPQVILNFKRKSVTGLSLDFVFLNVIGFTCYSAFNIGLYFVPYIQEEYFRSHPSGVIPVQVNDLAFSIHALIIMAVGVVQCIVFDRGSQRISRVCVIIVSLMLLFIFVSTVLAISNVITWLTCLYFYSYVKLSVTLIKYIPQVILNFRRKSNVGWSVTNFVFDFVGGVFSIAQMFIIAFNCNDWGSILGSPTKLGLGVFSAAFDTLFFVQHRMYRRTAASSEVEDTEGGDSDTPLTADAASSSVEA